MEETQTPHDNQETQTSHENQPTNDYHSNVDTSRPFRSVKEAVAIFGDRFLTGGEISSSSSPKPTSWKSTPSPQPPKKNRETNIGTQDHALVNTLKKLESELEETKKELKLLKERESETEVALASLNAELHKNMSKIAQAEADEAGKRVVIATRSSIFGEIQEEESYRRRDTVVRMDSDYKSLPTLGQVLSVGEDKNKKKKKKKKTKVERKVVKKIKPIVPLVGYLFSRKKETSSSSSAILGPLYGSAQVYWN